LVQTRLFKRASLLCSAVLHGCLLLFLLFGHASARVVKTRLPGTKAGTVISLSYNPGGISRPAVTKVKTAARPLTETASSLKPQPPVPKPASKASASAGESGESSLGDGDISIALMRYFPQPSPDLSTLQRGTAGDVVIDIVIDADGHISQSNVVRGVGKEVDQAVLATVQTWTFAPATKDGVAVASRQEILFHYERS
jgi:protein TonB